MKFGGGPDNWAGNCMGDCTGLCETCALRRTRADLAEATALLTRCYMAIKDSPEWSPSGLVSTTAAFLARVSP